MTRKSVVKQFASSYWLPSRSIHQRIGLGAELLSGVMSMATSTAAPLMRLYLMYHKRDKASYLVTLALRVGKHRLEQLKRMIRGMAALAAIWLFDF